jgi:hypothetical protein
MWLVLLVTVDVSYCNAQRFAAMSLDDESTCTQHYIFISYIATFYFTILLYEMDTLKISMDNFLSISYGQFIFLTQLFKTGRKRE